MLPRAADELKWMPASPETSNWSAALSRPAYLNVPSFAISSRRAMCFTCALPLISSSVSSPSKPFALLENGTSCSALYCSSWIQVGQDVVIGTEAAFLSLIALAAATTSCHVAGGFSGSRSALRKASLLYHITAVDELNGIDAIRP